MLLLLAALLPVAVAELAGWTGSSFPDVRGPSVDQCGDHMPRDTGYLPYVCDPDKVLNRSESKKRVHAHSAIWTRCSCANQSETAQVGHRDSVSLPTSQPVHDRRHQREHLLLRLRRLGRHCEEAADDDS